MALKVLSSRPSGMSGRVTITVESDCSGPPFVQAFGELQRDSARTALEYASANGLSMPAVNGSPTAPYPVNASGIPLDQVDSQLTAAGKNLPPDSPDRQPHRYRVDVPVVSRGV